MHVGVLTQTIKELVRAKIEHGWVEFKANVFDADKVGHYISALANTAAIEGQRHGYVVWGVHDGSRQVIGTSVNPWTEKVGNEDAIPWLRRGISPDSADFEFHELELEGLRVVALAIPRADTSPVQFKGVEYVRDGSYTKDLRQFPIQARALWRSFDQTPFEARPCLERVDTEGVLRILNLDTYCTLTGQPLSSNSSVQLGYLEADRMVERVASNQWNVLNLGALCLARRLDEFPSLQRKAVRFVVYADASRATAVDSVDGAKGYAVGFEGLLDYIEGRLPRREITDPIRRIEEHFPRISVRELIANALIHQDFTITGSGPLIELFPDRLEISNPGVPLVEDTRRLLDCPPQSRNERFAGFMRKAGICEERGSGIDKSALAAENAQLPAPEIRVAGASTVAVLLGPRSLSQMDTSDRLWATYLHAALRYVNQQDVTNSTVRARFGIADHNSARASRLLGEAVEAELIRPRDPMAGRKNMKYVPFWA